MDAKIKALTIVVSVVLILTAGCSESQYSSRKSYSSSKRTSSNDSLEGFELLGEAISLGGISQAKSNEKSKPKPLSYDPLVDAPPKVGLPHSFDAVTTKKAIRKAVNKFEKINSGFVNNYANNTYKRVQRQLSEKGQSSLSEINKSTFPGLPMILTGKVTMIFRSVKVKDRFVIGVYWYADKKLEGADWSKAPGTGKWCYSEWVY